MIISNIKGGLGNQMFQYAYGRALSIKNHDVLKLDVTSINSAGQIGNIHRPLSLKHFSIAAVEATLEEISTNKPNYYYKKIINKIFGDRSVCFNKKYLEKKGDQYLDGYWQSPLFFNEIRDTLLKDFTLKGPLSPSGVIFAENISKTNSISIHVRRGDYVNNSKVNKEFGLCSLDYYRNAMRMIESKTINPHFFIFSDDMEWVKANLELSRKITFVDDKSLTDAEELVLMSKCDHNIIANSSFSWWAAWLNQNQDKTVIAPTPWFDHLRYDEHLIPKSWIQLPK